MRAILLRACAAAVVAAGWTPARAAQLNARAVGPGAAPVPAAAIAPLDPISALAPELPLLVGTAPAAETGIRSVPEAALPAGLEEGAGALTPVTAARVEISPLENPAAPAALGEPRAPAAGSRAADAVSPAVRARAAVRGVESAGASSSERGGPTAAVSAAARGGALAFGEVFDGSARPAPGEAPDFGLIGSAGEDILETLRRAADAALLEKDRGLGLPPPGAGGERPAGWARRVDQWILGQQSLMREPLTQWLAARSYKPRFRGGAALDVETFLVALAKVNAALEGLAPPLRAADLFILGEGEAVPGTLVPSLPDLRAVGTFHGDGRVQVYAGLAEILSPEELAGAVLREHLALRGFPYGAAVKAMQAVTRKAFGRPVLGLDLQGAARRALAAPGEDARPAWGPEEPRAPEPEGEPFWPRWQRWTAMAVLSLTALGAALVVVHWAVAGRLGLAGLALAALVAFGAALTAVGSRAARRLEERRGRNAPVHRLDGVEYRFDPSTLRLLERNDGVDETRRWSYSALIFEDARGWRVAVIPHAVTSDGADHALEVQWGFHGLGDSTRGYFFIFAPSEFVDHPEVSGHAVRARDFDRALLADFRRAIERYLRSPGLTAKERASIRDLMRSFVSDLKSKEDGFDGEPPAGTRAA